MLFMVVERFRVAMLRRCTGGFASAGEMPEGLHYRGSWIETNFDRCFQLMECDDESLFAGWIAKWNDLADFEVVPVATSEEIQKMFPRT